MNPSRSKVRMFSYALFEQDINRRKWMKKERKRQRKCVCVNNEKQRDSNYANEASSWNWPLAALTTTLLMGGINKMLSYWLSRVNISISV